jgi:hypothetical protein
MNLEEKPPELDAGSSANISALFLLEMENSNLRRLVVELLEKNQQLREQLRAKANGRNPETPGDFTTHHKVDRHGVDPQAA